MKRNARNGFSLMEVMLSTAILVGSSIALIELANIGRKQASAAYDLNRAQLLCQSKLDEIVSGISPLKSVESQEFEDDPEWLYSIEQTAMRERRLVEVTVSVFQQERPHHKAQRFTLVRWLPDNFDEPVGASTRDGKSTLPQRSPRSESRR